MAQKGGSMIDKSTYKKEHDEVLDYAKEQIGINLNEYRDGDGSDPFTTTYWDINGPKVCINWSGKPGGMNEDAKAKLSKLALRSNGKLSLEQGGAWFKFIGLNINKDNCHDISFDREQ